MSIPALAQVTVFEDPALIALRLPLGATLSQFHPQGCFPLVRDPRSGCRASIVGMMVLRPANQPWMPGSLHVSPVSEMAETADWCFAVKGVGGSWPISGGNAVDAFRLALQYGTVDAVMAGASTVAREGLRSGARPGHLWQPYTPLAWPALRAHRERLEPAITALRVLRQEQGVLSSRRHPAQIAITRGGQPRSPSEDVLDARIFHDSHPDGSPIEAWLLTSAAGEVRLRERARRKGLRLEDRFLVCSPPGLPEEIDVAGVPELLRSKLDARLVEHDGGAVSLSAFLAAGAIDQLNLTLMRRRSVHEVIATTDRIEPHRREEVLGNWEAEPQLFPQLPEQRRGVLPARWRPFYAVAEQGPDAEAVVVSLDTRAG